MNGETIAARALRERDELHEERNQLLTALQNVLEAVELSGSNGTSLAVTAPEVTDARALVESVIARRCGS